MQKPPETDTPAPGLSFRDLALPEPLLKALADVGYEAPSPIQAQTIPPLLDGRDVLGMAQTGTGKTAAFALPILARIDLKKSAPQALVLAPTRELAIQVAEAFQKYASHLPGFHVLPIYGGQSYGPQLSALRRGAHVIVGTPGRVIDHMDRGTLKLDALRFVVLDEADEMLRMGFIDDVDKILKQTPDSRQVALFSATMPSQIRRIAQTHLKSPAEITVREKTATVANTRQRYWMGHFGAKLEALTRILEAEPFDGMLIFVRTKQETIELSSKLEARGFPCAPLNGDIDQRTRERTVARLKGGSLDIIVATDVAARGLDVERVSHVINYDVPTDTESYVHRIGRTGRAGRKGEAILFVMPRERHMLKIIERATRQTIALMELPSADAVLAQRLGKLKGKIAATLGDAKLAETLAALKAALGDYEREQSIPALDLAAAMAYLIQGEAPVRETVPSPRLRAETHGLRGKGEGQMPHAEAKPRERTPKRNEGLETFRIEVGKTHGVKPGNIVGAIANEAELDAKNIGRVQIFDDHSLVDLPEGMPKEVFKHLGKVWVSGQQLKISRLRK
jgi:ATP-dependent RNA helicase DeaD